MRLREASEGEGRLRLWLQERAVFSDGEGTRGLMDEGHTLGPPDGPHDTRKTLRAHKIT